jgi:beta-lactamase class D
MFYVIAAVFAVGASLFVAETEAKTICTIVADASHISDAGITAPILQQGNCTERFTPASTFKVALSLMGFDAGFLKDEHGPTIPFREGYTYWGNPAWRQPTDPAAWMKYSVVWYSQQITHGIGAAGLQKYVDAFHYGNRDLSGDAGKNNALDRAWISSSLKISPQEQAQFLAKIVNRKLPVDAHAIDMTASIMKLGMLPEGSDDGWQIYGKTGAAAPQHADGSYDKAHFYGWFVGWATKGDRARVFVRLIQEEKEEKISAGIRNRDAFLKELPALLDKN